MAFTDRISEHPNRVVLTPVSGEENTYEIDFLSAQGTVTEEGTSMTADDMNDAVQDLIDSAFNGASVNSNGTFTANNIKVGVVSITPTTANTVAQKDFPSIWSDAPFENPPKIIVCPQTSVPNQVQSWGIKNVTNTGFTLYLLRTNTTQTQFHYIAIGV